jgi:hypothetical protein
MGLELVKRERQEENEEVREDEEGRPQFHGGLQRLLVVLLER